MITLKTRGALMKLTKAKWKELRSINERTNHGFSPESDKANYGEIEYWIPAQLGNGRADCEDYALAKIYALVAKGWPREELKLAVCYTTPGDKSTGHCVLTIDTEDKGTVALDNLVDVIRNWEDTQYEWYARERPGHKTWEMISGDRG